jgi:hypothetical protein
MRFDNKFSFYPDQLGANTKRWQEVTCILIENLFSLPEFRTISLDKKKCLRSVRQIEIYFAARVFKCVFITGGKMVMHQV